MTPAFARRLRAALSIGAALVAIALLDGLHMNYDSKLAPFLVAGRIGEPVQTRAFALTVTSLELAQSVAAQDDAAAIPAKPLSTSGVWRVVHARLDARDAPLTLLTATLHTRDGYDYAAADARIGGTGSLPYSRQLLNRRITAPGLASDGLLLFEIPAARLEGVRLRASQASGKVELDDLADIDLGLDARRSEELARALVPLVAVRGDLP